MKISNKPVGSRQSTVGRKSKQLTQIGMVLALMAFGSLLRAQDKKVLSVKDVSDLVEAAQLAALDAQMDLRMEMKDSLSGQTQNYEGKVFTKSPGKVYVHYTKPEEQFLYVGPGLPNVPTFRENGLYSKGRQGQERQARLPGRGPRT